VGVPDPPGTRFRGVKPGPKSRGSSQNGGSSRGAVFVSGTPSGSSLQFSGGPGKVEISRNLQFSGGPKKSINLGPKLGVKF
jgi:hypothetical protein